MVIFGACPFDQDAAERKLMTGSSPNQVFDDLVVIKGQQPRLSCPAAANETVPFAAIDP